MSERTKSKHVSWHEVCYVLSKEREYQNQDVNPDVMSVGDELVLLRAYLRDAEDAFKTGFGDDHEKPTMDVIRKLGGICIRAMQNHGAVPRTVKTPRLKQCPTCNGADRPVPCNECDGSGRAV